MGAEGIPPTLVPETPIKAQEVDPSIVPLEAEAIPETQLEEMPASVVREAAGGEEIQTDLQETSHPASGPAAPEMWGNPLPQLDGSGSPPEQLVPCTGSSHSWSVVVPLPTEEVCVTETLLQEKALGEEAIPDSSIENICPTGCDVFLPTFPEVESAVMETQLEDILAKVFEETMEGGDVPQTLGGAEKDERVGADLLFRVVML